MQRNSIYRKRPEFKQFYLTFSFCLIWFVYRKLILAVSVNHTFQITLYYARTALHPRERAGALYLHQELHVFLTGDYPVSEDMETMGIEINDVHILKYRFPQVISLMRQYWVKWPGTGTLLYVESLSATTARREALQQMQAVGPWLHSLKLSNDYVVLNTSTPTRFSTISSGLWNFLEQTRIAESKVKSPTPIPTPTPIFPQFPIPIPHSDLSKISDYDSLT